MCRKKQDKRHKEREVSCFVFPWTSNNYCSTVIIIVSSSFRTNWYKKKKLDNSKKGDYNVSSIRTNEYTNVWEELLIPMNFYVYDNMKIPASNSNSAPSALVSLWRPPPLSSPRPSSCSWQAFGCSFIGWVGLCKLTPLKAGVTTMNFIHCLAKATRPFFKVTKAGRPSLFK